MNFSVNIDAEGNINAEDIDNRVEVEEDRNRVIKILDCLFSF